MPHVRPGQEGCGLQSHGCVVRGSGRYWPPTALPVLVPTPGGVGAFSSHKVLPSVAKTLSFVTVEFTCTSETWAISGRCFNENTSVKRGRPRPTHPYLGDLSPSASQGWQQAQEPPPATPTPTPSPRAGSQKLPPTPTCCRGWDPGQGLAAPSAATLTSRTYGLHWLFLFEWMLEENVSSQNKSSRHTAGALQFCFSKLSPLPSRRL